MPGPGGGASFPQPPMSAMDTTTTNASIFRRIPRADGLLLLITLIWGSTFSLTKVTLLDISPYIYQGARFTLASILVGIYTWRDIRATTRRTLWQGVVLGVLLGLGFILQTVGLAETTASKAGFLTGTLVVFTPVFQLVIERRMPTIPNLIGVLLTSIGLFVFTSPTGGQFNLGDFLVLLCAVVFAVYVVLIDIFTKERFNAELVFFQFATTAIIGFALAPVFDQGQPNTFTTNAILALIYLAVFASCIALFVQTKYQRETTPTRAALIYTMEPIFAAIIAVVTIGETMNGVAVLGAGLMLSGLLVSEVLTAWFRRDA